MAFRQFRHIPMVVALIALVATTAWCQVRRDIIDVLLVGNSYIYFNNLPEMIEGISTALFTTLVGLFIAIPALTVYSLLRNRAARPNLEVGILSEDLMSRFAGARKGKR